MSFNNNLASKSLDAVSRGRANNLNAIRLLAATLVIASHSFALRFGTRGFDYEPLLVFTRGMLSMGGLAVGFFFLYGGFLIARSAEAHSAAKDYFKRRIARIFPELIAVVLLCAFVLGPILSRLSVADYFLSSQTYLYLFNALLIPVHNLPGVFENNVYQYVVNGSLWTLPVEFACYALVFFSLKITSFEYKRFSWLFLPFSVALAAYIYMPSIRRTRRSCAPSSSTSLEWPATSIAIASRSAESTRVSRCCSSSCCVRWGLWTLRC